MCRKIIVAGAKAGMKQKGKVVNTSTPKAPVSMLILVRMMAVAEVIKISRKPKVFQKIASLRAYLCSLLMSLAIHTQLKAVIISPVPAIKAKVEGSTLSSIKTIKKLPISLNL